MCQIFNEDVMITPKSRFEVGVLPRFKVQCFDVTGLTDEGGIHFLHGHVMLDNVKNEWTITIFIYVVGRVRPYEMTIYPCDRSSVEAHLVDGDILSVIEHFYNHVL